MSNAGGVTPAPGPVTSDDQERLRILVGGALIVVSMMLVCFALWMAIQYADSDLKAGKPVGDVVAILGAVTTFLGSAAGLFFGINAGQAGKGQLTAAAQAATQTASVAGNVAQAATQAASAAGNMAQQAATAVTHATAQRDSAVATANQAEAEKSSIAARLKRLQLRHTDTMSLLKGVVPVDTPLHAQFQLAMAPLRQLPPDNQVLSTIYDIVTNWLAPIVLVPANQIDTSLLLMAARPAGVGLSAGQYLQLCRDCATQVNEAFGTSITLTADWTNAHMSGTIDIFANDLARLVLGG